MLEADPTTATAVAASNPTLTNGWRANEADADAALALETVLADPDFTGQLKLMSTSAWSDSNLTKLHNVLRGTSIEIGNNIQMKPATWTCGSCWRVSDITEVPTQRHATAAGGVIVGGIYRSGIDPRQLIRM